jgi:arylsulfatase A-like enzyme
VCARPGYDLRARFEYQPHNGSHGGLHRDHMRVPAAVNGAWQTERVRSVDLFPSILASLGKPIPAAIDGTAIDIIDRAS